MYTVPNVQDAMCVNNRFLVKNEILTFPHARTKIFYCIHEYNGTHLAILAFGLEYFKLNLIAARRFKCKRFYAGNSIRIVKSLNWGDCYCSQQQGGGGKKQNFQH